jgi:hypothetical protein
MSEDYLFNKIEIHAVIEEQRRRVKDRVQSIPSGKLLNASEHDLVQALVEEFRLDIPVLKDDLRYLSYSGETKIEVSGDPRYMGWEEQGPLYREGNENVIAVPFEGEAEFFKIQPNRFTSAPPRAEIGKGELLLRYARMDHDAAAVRRESEQTIKEIKDYLSWLQEAVTPFNDHLEDLVRSQVKQRKDRLLADANMAEAIGLPMKKREGVPVTYTVPIKRRVAKIEEIRVEGAFRPEPVLFDGDYEEILRIMKNMAQVMELSPRAFEDMEEEVLRSHFLVQLNGAYKGQATGETFNFEGKTDILIRSNGKNVFIAECKFWRGEKSFLKTIDQLLKYLSWRDTKAAVVVFNRKAGFSAVLAKIAELTPKHPQFKRDLGKPDESTFRYVFAQPNDVNREITLTVLAFDVPTTPAANKSG